jgi:D-arginine dehydrogenase
MITADIAIIGAGMAGASLAAAIGTAASVVLIEAESQPGYHATGRSAAFWSETYGGPAIQPLTTASHNFLTEAGFLKPRGALAIGKAGDEPLLDAFLEEFRESGVPLNRVGRREIERMVPTLRPEWQAGVYEPSCQDIEVAALHAHYLKSARASGVQLLTDAEVLSLTRDDGRWKVETRAGAVSASIVVNAAGAWASPIAAMAGALPIEISPFRRTVIQLIVDPAASADLPLTMDRKGSFYIKPEADGRLWLSPHDEVPTVACDAAPEELDIAIAIDRFQHAFDWRIVKLEHSWAGLRSFAPDRAPVYGFDGRAAGFFWFAGQGGFGIQTAPAAAEIGAALLLDRPLPDVVGGIDIGRYAPDRF